MFSMFRMRNCLHDSAEVVEPSQLEEVEVEREASVRHIPTKIVGGDTKRLRNKEVPLVKVQWGDDVADAILEAEEKILTSYPHLFDSRIPFPSLDLNRFFPLLSFGRVELRI